jgi:plastocyanin
MHNTNHGSLIDAVSARLENGHITRRQALRMLAAIGGIAALPSLGSRAAAQEGTPPATPVPGPRDDGTNLWRIQVGGMDMENRVDMHTFFPDDITVNAGDAVHFAFAPMGMPGFHTVTFLSGEDVPPLLVPDIVDGTPVPSPEGPPRLILNPVVAWRDERTDYDGTGYANAGLDVFHLDAGPYVLTFTTPGTFEYQCAVHGIVMKGKINVQEAGTDLPSDQAAYDAMSADRMAALIDHGKEAVAEAEAMLATPAASGAATWDVWAGLGGESQARVMRFIPGEVTIKVGDTVRWTDGSTGEPHTVMFLGGEEQPEDTIVEPQASGPPKFIQNFQTFLPSTDSNFDGTALRRSGFLGFLPEVNEIFGLTGDTWELTFTAPGEFPYYCVFHSGGPEDEMGMTGKVIVEA